MPPLRKQATQRTSSSNQAARDFIIRKVQAFALRSATALALHLHRRADMHPRPHF
jgi:hypothetical protein